MTVTALMPFSIQFRVIMFKPAAYTFKKQTHICLWRLMVWYPRFRFVNLHSLYPWPHSCCQYRAWWCPGSLRCQGISRHGTDNNCVTRDVRNVIWYNLNLGHSSCSPNLYDWMCKATTPVTKEKCVTSWWRQVSDITWLCGDLQLILLFICSIQSWLIMHNQDIPAPDKKITWCFCHTSLPTMINPLINPG